MTAKELAEFTGKNKSTVGRWLKKACCKMQSISCKMQQATSDKPADYSLEEVEVILNNSSMSKYEISILMQNARGISPAKDISQVNNTSQYVTKTELKELMTEMTKSFATTLANMIPEIVKQTVIAVNKHPLQIEQDYYSILGYCNKNNLPITTSEAIRLGKLATRLSRKKGLEIRRVDDERYGSVGSYHISVLDEVIAEK